MPTYQYRCTECGADLEAVQKFSDPALTECPNCAGPLRKVFNAVGVVFKGSGFYRTDSRNGSGNGASDSGSKEAKAGKSAEHVGANGSGAKKPGDDGSKGNGKGASPGGRSSSGDGPRGRSEKVGAGSGRPSTGGSGSD
jgi:putative FmdB family regulatory protein